MAVLTKLRDLRLRKNVSQTYLAAQLGFKSATGYNSLERGRKRYVTEQTITKLADLLAVEPAEIIEALRQEEKAHEHPAEAGPV